MKLDTQERIVNQSISHAHHRHAKMEARADKPDIIHTIVNAHQVKKTYKIHFFYFNRKIIRKINCWLKMSCEEKKSSLKAENQLMPNRNAYMIEFGGSIKNMSD